MKISFILFSLTLVILFFFNFGLNAQNPCGHEYFINHYKNQNTNFVQSVQNQESFITNYINNNLGTNGYVEATNPIATSSYVIPVLVHIIEDPNAVPSTIISYGQVESQIDALNAHFNMGNNPIQFCLVKNNHEMAANWLNAEPGVLRYDNNNIANWANHYNTLPTPASANALSAATNTASYNEVLNIWVVNTINANPSCSGIMGFSPLPLGAGSGNNLDGVVVLSRVFGNNNTPIPNNYLLRPNFPGCANTAHFDEGKAVVHEVGHYLNLYHTFQNNLLNPSLGCVGANVATDGDFCADTDPVLQPPNTYTFGSPIPTTCSNGPDNVNNFMYYADDRTTNIFTPGQYNRMTTYLTQFRSGLYATSNLNDWGLIGTGAQCITAQVFADFNISGNNCTNTNITFSPSVPSPNNTAGFWNWTISPATGWNYVGGTSSSPIFNFTNPGLYTITCNASDTNTSTPVQSFQTLGVSSCGINQDLIHNSQWYFGCTAAFDFTVAGSTPDVNTAPRLHNPPSIFAKECATSYADDLGNTLFYTNGPDFWDANDVKINTSQIFTTINTAQDVLPPFTVHPSGSQRAGIMTCPHPDINKPNEYLIFATKDGSFTTDIRYVSLNMNTKTFSPVSTIPNTSIHNEIIQLIPHCNGRDYWFIYHTTTTVVVRLVSTYGVSPNPVFTFVDPTGGFGRFIKASPDNTLLAIPNTTDIWVFDFDNSTGVLSNQTVITGSGQSGISFNSNSDKIYYKESGGSIYYYDLISNTTATVPISAGTGNFSTNEGLQLAPDDNIYANRHFQRMSRIINANSNTPSAESGTIGYGTTPGIGAWPTSIPRFMDGIKEPITPLTMTINYTSCDDIELSLPTCWEGYDYHIDWGDGNTTTTPLLTVPQNVAHNYTTGGSYTVTVTLLPPGTTTIPPNPLQITQVVNIYSNPITITASTPPCLNATPGTTYSVLPITGATYNWSISGAAGTIINSAPYSNTVDVQWTGVGTGTVNVTVSFNSVCTLSGSLSVTVNPLPIVAVTPTVANICLGSNVQLTASGASTYSWTPTSPISTSNPLIASPTTTTTYTVIGADANGCTGFATVTVNVSPTATPTITSTATPNPVCVGGNVQLAALGAGAGGVYNWVANPSVPNTFVPPGSNTNNPTPQVSPSVPTNYIVTATDGFGCTGSSLVSVGILPGNQIACCAPGSSYPDGIFTTEAALISALGTSPTTKVFAIDASMTLTQNFTFTDCDIYVAPDVQITVAPNTTLSIIDQSTVQAACSTMWKGIKATDPSAHVFISGSEISDMQDGIVLENGAKINCTNTDFRNNYIAMQLINSPAGYNANNSSCNIQGNTFRSDGLSNLLKPYDTKDRGEHGIKIIRCNEAEIGAVTITSPSNTFSRLRNGIYISRPVLIQPQDIKIWANSFEEIYEGGYYGQPIVNQWYPYSNPNGTVVLSTHYSTTNYLGCAIFGAEYGNGPFFQSPAQPHKIMTTGSSFLHCNKAVSINEVKAEVIGNNIADCHQGVLLAGMQGVQVSVDNNTINDVYSAVRINGQPYNSSISDNTIGIAGGVSAYTSLVARAGISIKALNNLGTYPVEIRNNNIQYNPVHGPAIQLMNTKNGIQVADNTITFTSTNPNALSPNVPSMNKDVIYGIQAYNAKAAELKCNYIHSTFNPTVFNARDAVGIGLNKSPKFTIECNKTEGIRLGWNIITNCRTSTSSIRGNKFKDHWVAMLFRHLGDDGTLGDIGDANNDNFDNTANAFSNTKIWSNGQGNFDLFRFAGNSGSLDRIFTQQNVSLGASTAGGGYQFGPFVTPVNFYQCQSGFCANLNFPVAGYGVEDGDWADDVATDNAYYQEFHNGAEGMDERELYAQLYFDPSALNNDIDYQNFYLTEQASYTDEMLQIDLLISQLPLATSETEYNSWLNQAIALNNSIINGEGTEMNEKIINEYYFNWLAYGDAGFDVNDKTVINNLADQCPYVAGQAVYKARMLQASYEPNRDHNDILICNALGVYKNGTGPFTKENELLARNQSNTSVKALTENEVRVYPNPAEDFVSIKHSMEGAGEVLFKLYDASGRVVKSLRCKDCSQETKITLDNMAMGIYTYKILWNQRLVKSGKLNIIK